MYSSDGQQPQTDISSLRKRKSFYRNAAVNTGALAVGGSAIYAARKIGKASDAVAKAASHADKIGKGKIARLFKWANHTPLIRFARGDYFKRYAKDSDYSTTPEGKAFRDAAFVKNPKGANAENAAEAMIRADIKTNLSGKHTELQNYIQQQHERHNHRQEYLKAEGQHNQAAIEDKKFKQSIAHREREYGDRYLGKTHTKAIKSSVLPDRLAKKQTRMSNKGPRNNRLLEKQQAITAREDVSKSMAGELRTNHGIMQAVRKAAGNKPTRKINEKIASVIPDKDNVPGLKSILSSKVKRVMEGDPARASKLRKGLNKLATKRLTPKYKNPEKLETAVRNAVEPIVHPEKMGPDKITGGPGGKLKRENLDKYESLPTAKDIGSKLKMKPENVKRASDANQLLTNWTDLRKQKVTKHVLKDPNIFKPLVSALNDPGGYPYLKKYAGKAKRIGKKAGIVGALAGGAIIAKKISDRNKETKETRFASGEKWIKTGVRNRVQHLIRNVEEHEAPIFGKIRSDKVPKNLARILPHATAMNVEGSELQKSKAIQSRIAAQRLRVPKGSVPPEHEVHAQQVRGIRKTVADNLRKLRKPLAYLHVAEEYKGRMDHIEGLYAELKKASKEASKTHKSEIESLRNESKADMESLKKSHSEDTSLLRGDVKRVLREERSKGRRHVAIAAGAGLATGVAGGRASKSEEHKFSIFKRIGKITIVGKPKWGPRKSSNSMLRIAMRQNLPNAIVGTISKMTGQTKGQYRDYVTKKIIKSHAQDKRHILGTAAGGRSYISRRVLKDPDFKLREVIHHEGFHTIPIIGHSEIAAHFVGGLKSKKGKISPIEGIKRIGHLVKSRPDRAALEAAAIAGGGYASSKLIKKKDTKSEERKFAADGFVKRTWRWAKNPETLALTGGLGIAEGAASYVRPQDKETRPQSAVKGATSGLVEGGVLAAAYPYIKRVARQAGIKARNVVKASSKTKPIYFGLLGHPLKYRRPAFIKTKSIPAHVAGFVPPQNVATWSHPSFYGKKLEHAKKHGAILTSSQSMGKHGQQVSRIAGYKDIRDFKKAMLRHELVHSIQSAKGAKDTKIRHLIKNEVGAYSAMRRGEKGSGTRIGKITRGISRAMGIPASVGYGVINNPKLKKRAIRYAGAGAAAGAIGTGVVVIKKRSDKKEMASKDSRIAFAIKRSRTTTHDKVFSDGSRIDISKLIKKTQDRTARTVPMNTLRAVPTSKESGFNNKRLKKANIAHPILIDQNNNVIDGRHRVIKKQRLGHTHINAIRVSAKDLKSVQLSVKEFSQMVKRPSVAMDRYKKMIHERETQRKESNYDRSAIAGALVAGALHHKLKGSLGKNLLKGAGVGIAAQAATRAITSHPKDQFGDESFPAKRVQKLPWQLGGIAAAGITANRAVGGVRNLRKKFKFSSSAKTIHFAKNDDTPTDFEKWAKNPSAKADILYRNINRVKRLHKDFKNKQEGTVERDQRGRPKTPEWKKPWVTRTVGTGLLVGAIGVARHQAKAARVAGAFGKASPFSGMVGKLIRGKDPSSFNRKISRPILKARRELLGIKRDIGNFKANKEKEVIRQWKGAPTEKAQSILDRDATAKKTEEVRKRLKTITAIDQKQNPNVPPLTSLHSLSNPILFQTETVVREHERGGRRKAKSHETKDFLRLTRDIGVVGGAGVGALAYRSHISRKNKTYQRAKADIEKANAASGGLTVLHPSKEAAESARKIAGNQRVRNLFKDLKKLESRETRLMKFNSQLGRIIL